VTPKGWNKKSSQSQDRREMPTLSKMTIADTEKYQNGGDTQIVNLEESPYKIPRINRNKNNYKETEFLNKPQLNRDNITTYNKRNNSNSTNFSSHATSGVYSASREPAWTLD
jgi:hypothetical protein